MDAAISAMSRSGERFRTSSKICIVHNVDKAYLSYNVLVGRRIVNKFFPAAGAGNQHGAASRAWDRPGTVVELEQLPHASYEIKVDGSGRLMKRTRLHLKLFRPNDANRLPQVYPAARQIVFENLP